MPKKALPIHWFVADGLGCMLLAFGLVLHFQGASPGGELALLPLALIGAGGVLLAIGAAGIVRYFMQIKTQPRETPTPPRSGYPGGEA
jgi:hypothetical protein